MACTIYAYLRRSGAGPGAFGCLGEGPGFPLGPPWVQTALKISNRKQANRVGGVAKCMKNVVREFSFLWKSSPLTCKRWLFGYTASPGCGISENSPVAWEGQHFLHKTVLPPNVCHALWYPSRAVGLVIWNYLARSKWMPAPLGPCKAGACITLHYITLHHTTLHYTTLHCITLHYTTLHCTTLHYTTLHRATLHHRTLQYITLHYPSPHTPDHTTLHRHSWYTFEHIEL